MPLNEILSWFAISPGGSAFILAVGILSLIQVAPIKVNPWDSILGWLGTKINAGVKQDLEAVRERSDSQQEEFREFWIDYQREAILRFARECSQEMPHSREEWNHILDIIKKYELFCEKHEIANGVIEENSAYLRSLHKQLLKEHRI